MQRTASERREAGAEHDSGVNVIGAGNDALGPCALSFVQPPDFEAPADANGDNVYEVTLSVSDGQAMSTLALRLTVTNVASGGFAVRVLLPVR